MSETSKTQDALIRDLAEASPDEAARILRKLPKRQRAAAAATLALKQREEVLALAEHKPGTAGSLMTSRYADLPADISAKEAVRRLSVESEAETIYTAYVVDAERHLLGVVGLRDLLRAKPQATVGAVMMPEPETALVADNDEDTARRALEEPRLALPVVDAGNHLLGIVTFDDAHRRLEEASQEDSERFHAVSGETLGPPYIDVPLWKEIRRRAPWIVSLAIVGLFAGYVVHAYESALDQLVILALYMPMLADTGGNVGTQSASLVMRSIATGEISLKDSLRVIWKEARVALILALILFVFAFIKVQFLSGSSQIPDGLSLGMIALAISLAIAVQVFVSTLIGGALPLAALVVRQDPAVVAGPALTTIVDVVGLLLYFMITISILGLNVP